MGKVTREFALNYAAQYDLREEVRALMDEENMSPEEALEEYGLY